MNPLKKYREENKMTQVELAKKLGYTSMAVSRWERGAKMPPQVEFLIKKTTIKKQEPKPVIGNTNINQYSESFEEKTGIFRFILIGVVFAVCIFYLITIIGMFF